MDILRYNHAPTNTTPHNQKTAHNHTKNTDRASVISNDKNHDTNYTKNYHDVIFNDPEHVENYTLGKPSVIKHGRKHDKNYTKLIQ